MPMPDFDPMDGLSEEDLAHIAGHKTAFERQAAAHGLADEARKRKSDEHRRATQLANGISPTDDAPIIASPVGNVATGAISVMIAVADDSGGIPATTPKFAPDWNAMKDIIVKYNGTWLISRHEVPSQVANILGFFGKDGWPKPADSEKETFEAIVKNGRVFRTDP